ncbi:MAG: pilus assembly protein [Alphaproteobacteria bacterium]|nr:pilus assembly protein [Alphaproteobacteria bacterium]
MLRSFLRSTLAFAGRFGGAKSGNVAMMYGLLLIPTIAAVGSAIDLTRAMVVKMRLGEALDAAGLAVGGTVGLSDAEMTAKAQKFFYANYPTEELGTVMSLSVTSTGQNNNLVSVGGIARVETAFMGLFGIDHLDVNVGVQVTRESKGLEIALVLDNTGSMASNGKIAALKTATNELIEILFGDQVTPTHLKMSLVPFSQTVKVDTTQFLNNGWMDTAGQASTAKLNFDNNKYAFSVWQSMSNKSWGGCLEARPGGLEEKDDVPNAAQPDTQWVPYFEPDGPDSSAYSGYTTYISDGISGNEETRLKRSAKYNGQNKTNPNADCNMQKILPLTNNKLTVKSYVNGMIATGYTHVAIGAGWGWRTLSPSAPYTEGSQYGDPDWQKAMVLLTDGLNTTQSNNTWHKSTYTAYNYLIRNQLGTTSANQSELNQDSRATTVCGRAKAEGVRVYSILLQEDDTRAQNMMMACASPDDTQSIPASKKCNGNGSKLCYLSPSGSDLQEIFRAIALDLSNLRLSE